MANIQFQDVSEQRKSEVWKHFLYVKDQQTPKCSLCSVILIAGASCTRSLINHLKLKQKISVSSCNEASFNNIEPKSKTPRIDAYFTSSKANDPVSELIAR